MAPERHWKPLFFTNDWRKMLRFSDVLAEINEHHHQEHDDPPVFLPSYSVTQTVLRTFQIFFHRARLFALLAATAWVPYFLVVGLIATGWWLTASADAKTRHPLENSWFATLAVLMLFIVFPVMTSTCQAASLRATAELYAGRKPFWKDVLRLGWGQSRTWYHNSLSPFGCVVIV